MTLPRERVNALESTRYFLEQLMDPKATPRIPAYIRKEARWCLKHFPWAMDFETLVIKCNCGVFREKGKKK